MKCHGVQFTAKHFLQLGYFKVWAWRHYSRISNGNSWWKDTSHLLWSVFHLLRLLHECTHLLLVKLLKTNYLTEDIFSLNNVLALQHYSLGVTRLCKENQSLTDQIVVNWYTWSLTRRDHVFVKQHRTLSLKTLRLSRVVMWWRWIVTS